MLIIDRLISAALEEDIGSGDVTADSVVDRDRVGTGEIIAKESMVLAGLDVARKVFLALDPTIEFKKRYRDGDRIEKGAVFVEISGNLRILLKGERTAINFLQHLSGIATLAGQYADRVAGTGVCIVDTRKTTPLLRELEKYSVRMGRGENHRMGLYDMIMLKDNHIDFAGGVDQAIEKTKAYLKKNRLDLKIIVEARSLNEIETILKHDGIHRILIDNFNYQDTVKAVKLIGDKCQTESSGGITLATARAYAECGVDYISSGAITHSVSNMDLSLKAM